MAIKFTTIYYASRAAQIREKSLLTRLGKTALADTTSEGKAGLKRFRLAICVTATTPVPSGSKNRSPLERL